MIKPIETEYNGLRFRSRLEARWAVFFDSARIKYIYEQEGYLLDNGVKYLPDFYLPDLDCHVEVKADTPEGRREILDKCFPAIQWGGPIKKILVLSDVPEGRSVDGGYWHHPIIYWHDDSPIWGWWFFFECFGKIIGKISSMLFYRDPGYLGTISACSDKVLGEISVWPCAGCIDPNPDFPTAEFQNQIHEVEFSCYAKARQARFEHGEKPKEVQE